MKRIVYLILMLLAVSPTLRGQDAAGILKQTTQAFGGKAWDTINFIRMHYMGHQHWLEQSENPAGPFITSYFDAEELRATRSLKLSQKMQTKTFQSPQAPELSYVQSDSAGYMAFGERKIPLYAAYRDENLRWMQYAPERLLQLALTSEPRVDKVLDLEGVKHYQLSFTANKLGYTLFINASTFLLSEAHVDTYSPNEFFFSIWGKFSTRIQYSIYELSRHQVMYPMQWDIYRTGQLWKKITINEIEFRQTTDESVFAVSDDIRKATRPAQNVQQTTLAVDKAIEVAKGIFVIPGNWFTGWAEQEDGIVVIEAPISSGYSVQLMNEVKKRYPAKKIKAVIVSSDAWPHLGGAREYVAANIPVYTNKLNKPILDRLARADYSPGPDAQQNRKAQPVFQLVDKPVNLNDAALPIQIFPINGEGGERMVAVYFPTQKVLYAGDLIQQQRDKTFFFIEYLAEVKAVVDRHKLDVEIVYAMHTAPLPWKDIIDTLERNK